MKREQYLDLNEAKLISLTITSICNQISNGTSTTHYSYISACPAFQVSPFSSSISFSIYLMAKSRPLSFTISTADSVLIGTRKDDASPSVMTREVLSISVDFVLNTAAISCEIYPGWIHTGDNAVCMRGTFRS